MAARERFEQAPAAAFFTLTDEKPVSLQAWQKFYFWRQQLKYALSASPSMAGRPRLPRQKRRRIMRE